MDMKEKEVKKSMNIIAQRLSQLRALKTEIGIEKERLETLRELAPYGRRRLGEPGGAPRGVHADRTGHYASEIAYLEQLIRENMQRAICELLRAQQFIDGIPDAELRCIFKLWYIKCKSWTAIAFALGGYDEQIPRKRHDRYLRRLEEERAEAGGDGAAAGK